MKLFLIFILAFLLSLPLAVSQENGTQTALQNLCPSTIAPKTQSCPDGSSVSCQPACDSATGRISDCVPPPCPTAQPGSGSTSTDTTTATSSNASSGGSGTATSTAITTSATEQNNTVIQPQPTSATPISQPICTQVTTLAADDGGNCKEFPTSCLSPGWHRVDKCPERNTVLSPDQMPQGCKEIKDETGFVKVVCETKPMECPQYRDEDVKKCESNNGKPNFFVDNRGCKIFECRFQQESGGFMQQARCPSEEERRMVSEKCKSNNMNPVIRRDYNGCNYVECVSAFKESPCPTSEDWERVSRDCAGKGGKTVTDHDYQGCNIPKCELSGRGSGEAGAGGCITVQKENFDTCRNEGGEMIVKENNGCITYAKCVMRGNERNLDYEEVGEIPQSSVLLSLAFKLEQLKIDFSKLSKQTDDIANYYASNGDKISEERFRKVSSMFIGANQKIDEIKNKMRERISSLTKEDIADFKHDIKYIREVVIQDILYVMLSTEGATSMPASSQQMEGCGNDGWCFNKALRTCEKTKFYPEGKEQTEIVIDGLDGKNCIIKASVSTPLGKKSMTCKYPNYVMGMERPEDLLPYCEGEMAEMAKQYAEKSRTSEKKVVPQRRIERIEPVPFESESVPEIR